MSPHANMQTYLAGMLYPVDSIEDRAAAFNWLLENFKPEEWPAYLDVKCSRSGNAYRRSAPMFNLWRFVEIEHDNAPTEIVFANSLVPCISRAEFIESINMQPELQNDQEHYHP